MHSTDDLNDGYVGSGKILQSSIKKYGKDNHFTEVISEHATREELRDTEEIEISRHLGQPLCMNIHNGGSGPYESFKMTKQTKENMSEAQLAMWRRPGEKEKRSIKQKEVQNRPEVKNHAKRIQKERWQDPAVRERHRIAHERMLQDVTFRKEFKKICKQAHNTPEALKNHSIARRKLTKEQAFAALEMNAQTGARRFKIAKALNLTPSSVQNLLKEIPCYKEWVDEWKSIRNSTR